MIPFYVLEALIRYCDANDTLNCRQCPARKSHKPECWGVYDYLKRRLFEVAWAKRRLHAGCDPTLTADPTRY